jgi:hypothetical protein
MRPEPYRPLLVGVARVVAALAALLATLLGAEFAIFRTWGIPMYADAWQIWALPVGQALALFVGTWIAAGGSGPGQPWRVFPFALGAALVIREAGIMWPGPWYRVWVVVLFAAALAAGAWLAVRRSRPATDWAAT